jgi:hypothetical protein
MRTRGARFWIGCAAATLSLACGTSGAVECRYAAKAPSTDKPPELTAHGACGEFAGSDDFRIAPSHLSRMRFRGGLAELQVDDKAFYVDRRGRAVRVHVFENGADYFAEGLARTVSGGKFGYVDRKLRVVIEPQYDFAFPFARGKAAVCLGCTVVAEGEHQAVRGGMWGVIDREGARIVPVDRTEEEVRAMQQRPERK